MLIFLFTTHVSMYIKHYIIYTDNMFWCMYKCIYLIDCFRNVLYFPTLWLACCVDKITIIFVFSNEHMASTPYHEQKLHILAHPYFIVFEKKKQFWRHPTFFKGAQAPRHVSKQSPSENIEKVRIRVSVPGHLHISKLIEQWTVDASRDDMIC